jgi:membrane protease YdiL (CAAX protease family)
MVLPGGLLVTLIYLWRRSLAFVVVIHAVLNAPLLLLPLLAPYM